MIILFLDTSRPPRTNEIDRQHYHFLSKEEMRRKIISNQFVEHGEQGGHFYGLSITTVRSIINQGKIGVMTIVPRVRHMCAPIIIANWGGAPLLSFEW